MSNIRISACLIVKNEEQRLASCLESIQPFVDEIIIGDTGSTDTTKQIAAAKGAIVIDVPWADDFAVARNAVLDKSSGDWLLVIDADEILVPVEGIREWLAGMNDAVGGVFVQVRSEILRADGDFDIAVASIVRLFRRHPAIRFRGSIHEQVWQSLTEAGLHIAPSPLMLLHEGYALPPEQMHLKRQRNLTMLEAALSSSPNDLYLRLQLGKTYLSVQRRQEAKECFAVLLARPGVFVGSTAQALNYSAQIAFAEGDLETAKKYACESLNGLPSQAFARFILGDIAFAEQQYEEALLHYKAMRDAQTKPDTAALTAGDLYLPPAQIAFRVGRCYAAMSYWGHAYREFSQGLQSNYKDKGCLVGMANISVRLGDIEAARSWVHKALSYNPGNEEIHLLHAQLHDNTSLVHPNPLPGLSAAIFAEDNDSGLKRALFSARLFCSSITVYHVGNAPFVQVLAAQFGAEYRHFPADIAHDELYNTAVRAAGGNWLLLLWHDEAFITTEIEKVASLLRSADAPNSIYTFDTEYREEELGARRKAPRLVVLPASPSFKGAFYPENTGIKPTHTNITVHRFAFPMAPEKQARYYKLLERAALQAEPTASQPLFDLGLYLLNFAMPAHEASALKILQKYASHPYRQNSRLAALLNSYCRHLITKGEFNTLEDLTKFSLETEPLQVEAYWYAYLSATSRQDIEALPRRYEQVVEAMEHKERSRVAPEKLPDMPIVIRFGLEASLALNNMDFATKVVGLALRHNAVYLLYDRLANAENRGNKPIVEALREAFALKKEAATTPEALPAAPPKTEPLLTLAMIVKNEEEMLPGCLESVAGIADEIVIVDTGSIDATKDIAAAHGATLLEMEWKDDFSAARNFGLPHCKGRWILYLDADERLAPEQKEYICDLLTTVPEHIGAVVCTIKSKHRLLNEADEQPATVHSGGYPRLFRNYGYPDIQFSGRVHEQISPSIIALGKELIDSEIVIEHLGYDRSPEVMEKKVRRNYELLMRHVKEEPDNAYSWFQLGQTLGFMGMDEQAISTLEFALDLGSLQKHIEASAAASIAQIQGRLKQFEEALRWAEISLEKSPEQLRALNIKAHALLYLNRHKEAFAAFSELKERNTAKRQGSPRAGYDIAIPDDIVERGLRLATSGKPIMNPNSRIE